MSVTGWKLDEADRALLLERFPPEWPDVIADHITLKAGAGPRDPLPQARQADIVDSVSDGEGLQALVVAIEGTTDPTAAPITSPGRLTGAEAARR